MRKSNHDHEDVPTKNPFAMGYNETYIRLAKERIIFLSENVTKDSAAELSAMLLYYDHENHDDMIELYIHSNGGDASGLSNIYDVMQMITAPIKTICIGKCYSAGAVLLAAGSKGQRYAFKSSKIMIHGIQAAFPILGHDVTNSKNYYNFLEDNNDSIMKMLAHHTGQPLEKLKQDCLRDVWLSPEDAIKYGLIDHILF